MKKKPLHTKKIGVVTTICCLSSIMIITLASSFKKDIPLIESKKKAIEEIRQTEKAFNQMLLEKGVSTAFQAYADSLAVIKRGEPEKLISGSSMIGDYYRSSALNEGKAYWAPTHIEVSNSLDLAFSYGNYKWLLKDKNGAEKEYTGIYLTIWKKQKDNTWKYVWD